MGRYLRRNWLAYQRPTVSPLIAGILYFSYLLRVPFSLDSLFHSVNSPQGRTPFGNAPNHLKSLSPKLLWLRILVEIFK